MTDLLEGQKLPNQGSVIIGTKGVMLIPHVGKPTLYPKKKFADHKIEVVPGGNHWHEFIDAVRGQDLNHRLILNTLVPYPKLFCWVGLPPASRMKHWYGMHQHSLLKVMKKPLHWLTVNTEKGWEVKGLG